MVCVIELERVVEVTKMSHDSIYFPHSNGDDTMDTNPENLSMTKSSDRVSDIDKAKSPQNSWSPLINNDDNINKGSN